MDNSIEAQIQKAELESVEEDKINFVREEILFPLRQKVMDLQQMIVINQQGIISLNVIRRNNKELIRGVTRAKNVTITALRTGAMVASALYDQKITMDKIKILIAALSPEPQRLLIVKAGISAGSPARCSAMRAGLTPTPLCL